MCYQRTVKKRAESTLLDFLKETSWRYNLEKTMLTYLSKLKHFFNKFAFQVSHNKSRYQYLLRQWQNQINEYAVVLN
jgi:hypothetical protein